MSSYSSSIVTMAISCIVSEMKRDIGRKSRFFIPSCTQQLTGGNPETVWIFSPVFYTTDQNDQKYCGKAQPSDGAQRRTAIPISERNVELKVWSKPLIRKTFHDKKCELWWVKTLIGENGSPHPPSSGITDSRPGCGWTHNCSILSTHSQVFSELYYLER